MNDSFGNKIKDKIINELNQDLYRNLNLSLYDADHYFGYYNGYIYKLIDRVYKKHGPSGLRKEIKYIVQYLIFLFNKLGFYNHRLIEHIGYKVEVFHNKFCNIIRYGGFNLYNAECFGDFYSLKKEMSISMQIIEKHGWINDLVKMDDDFFIKTKNMLSPEDSIYHEINSEFKDKYEHII